jgi:hypothetical protein
MQSSILSLYLTYQDMSFWLACANATGHNKSKVNFIKFYQIWNTSIRFNKKTGSKIFEAMHIM